MECVLCCFIFLLSSSLLTRWLFFRCWCCFFCNCFWWCCVYFQYLSVALVALHSFVCVERTTLLRLCACASLLWECACAVLCECVNVQTLLLCWRVVCLLCVRFCFFFLLSVCFSCTLADDFKLIFNVFVHSTENHTPHWKHFYECLRVRVFAVGFIQLFCFFFFRRSKQSES